MNDAITGAIQNRKGIAAKNNVNHGRMVDSVVIPKVNQWFGVSHSLEGSEQIDHLNKEGERVASTIDDDPSILHTTAKEFVGLVLLVPACILILEIRNVRITGPSSAVAVRFCTSRTGAVEKPQT
jgi:hypothetical protein